MEKKKKEREGETVHTNFLTFLPIHSAGWMISSRRRLEKCFESPETLESYGQKSEAYNPSTNIYAFVVKYTRNSERFNIFIEKSQNTFSDKNKNISLLFKIKNFFVISLSLSIVLN